MARFEDFYNAVLSCVPRATSREKQEIQQELADHLADCKDMLMGCGFSEEEAEKRAVERMGDPKEIGTAWNRQLSVLWLVVERLGRLAALLLILLCTASLFSGHLDLPGMAASVQIRLTGTISNEAYTAPYYQNPKWETISSRELDCRQEFGQHIMRLHRAELFRDGDQKLLYIHMLTYPKNPLHWVLGEGGYICDVTCNGEPASPWSEFSSRHVYAWYTVFYLDDQCETALLEMEHNGSRFSAELALDSLEVIS